MRRAFAGLLTSLTLFLVLSSVAHAGLQWDRTKIDLKPDEATEVAQTVIAFRNTGDKAVTILEVKPSCGCTTAILEKKTYRAGETGELRISVDLANATGTVSKSIEVLANDSDKPLLLTLRATIPEPLILSTKVLVWTTGEAGTAKEIPLTVNPSLRKTEVIAVRSPGTYFTATLRRDPVDGSQHLVVKPLTTATPSQEAIFIDAQTPPARATRSVIVVARVR